MHAVNFVIYIAAFGSFSFFLHEFIRALHKNGQEAHANNKPTPLPAHEVDAILKFTKLEAPKFELKFKVGETVKVIDGPFTDFLGKVDEIDEEKGKVKVLVSVFGRETPIELDFLQVSRL